VQVVSELSRIMINTFGQETLQRMLPTRYW